MSAGLLRPLVRSPLLWVILVGYSNANFAQIQGSAGQQGVKPFTATVAIREGYDSNPLTKSYQSSSDIQSSTYSSVNPSLGYNYTGLQADLSARYDFQGIYFPSLNQSYDIQYNQTFTGQYTYAFDPRFSITVADNFNFFEQPIATQFAAGLAPVTNTQGSIINLGTIKADYRVSDRLSMVTRWNNQVVNSNGSASYQTDPITNITTIQSGDQSQSNYMNNGAFQQFRLDFTPETVGTFTLDYQLFDYYSDQTFRDNQQVAFTLGADHTFLPTLFFTGRAGIQLNDNFGTNDNPKNVGSGGLNSGEQEIAVYPFVSLSSTWNYGQQNSVSAGFSIQVQQSTQATSSDSESYNLTLSSDHAFTEKLKLVQTLNVQLATYTPQYDKQQSILVYGGYQGSGQQTVASYNCKFSYAFYPYLSAELGYTFSTFQSYFDENNGNSGSYNRNIVYIGVRGTY
jgi:Putative beta-barrel porin 2